MAKTDETPIELALRTVASLPAELLELNDVLSTTGPGEMAAEGITDKAGGLSPSPSVSSPAEDNKTRRQRWGEQANARGCLSLCDTGGATAPPTDKGDKGSGAERGAPTSPTHAAEERPRSSERTVSSPLRALSP